MPIPYAPATRPDKRNPRSWQSGHALVIEPAEDGMSLTCQCGEAIGFVQGGRSMAVDAALIKTWVSHASYRIQFEVDEQ
jgi:hypothetical protein